MFLILEQYKNEITREAVDDINSEALLHIDQKLEQDIKWRADYWGKNLSHWDLALSDFPRQMSHSSAEFIDPDSTSHVTVKVEKQSLSSYGFFKDAHLIRTNFRCFHNSDGKFLIYSCSFSHRI